MKILGICASNITDNTTLNYEVSQLYDEAMSTYDDVIIFNPSDVTIELSNTTTKPNVYLEKRDLSQIESLIVRKSVGAEEETSVLVWALKEHGCYITDALTRFKGQTSSKSSTTLQRHKAHVGIDSYLCFTKPTAIQTLTDLHNRGEFPLLLKPVLGKGGEGIEYLDILEKAHQIIEDLFQRHNDNTLTILLQNYIEIVSEYRVMVFDDYCLGVAEKKQQKGIVQANAKQGGEFVAVHCPDVVNFAITHKTQQGILGIDVAINKENNFYILEENYAPKWETLDTIVQDPIAKQIIEYMSMRIGQRTK